MKRSLGSDRRSRTSQEASEARQVQSEFVEVRYEVADLQP